MLIKLNVLAFTMTASVRADLAAILSGIEGVELHTLPLASGALTTHIGDGGEADLVIIESDGSDIDLAAEVEAFTSKLPSDIVAYVVGDASSPTLLRRLMRAGVRDVLARPVVRQDLVSAVSGVLSEKRERAKAKGENVTSICSFIDAKGGSGGSLLAVNTAVSLATRHKARVALIDLDMQFGDCALLLDLAAQNNVGDALRQADRIDGVLLKALMTEHASGVHVLASPASLAAGTDLDAHAVRRIIDAAAGEYDVVVVDLPRVVSPWTVEAIRASTTTFVVVQNSLSTIRDARLLVDHLPRAGVDTRRIEIINNRAMAKSPSVPIEQLKQTLKHEKVHRVRNDYEAALAAEDQGMPIAKVNPRSDLAKDIDRLADYVWEAHGHGEGDSSKKEGLFERFFGKGAKPEGKA